MIAAEIKALAGIGLRIIMAARIPVNIHLNNNNPSNPRGVHHQENAYPLAHALIVLYSRLPGRSGS